VRPGEIITGRYEILRPVRSGGLGTVFEALDRQSAGKVAVKIINLDPSEDPALLRRIEREIEILSSLSHPHVVACLDSGKLPDRRPFLILEWLDGEDLADLKIRAPMTLRRVLEVAGQVADALAAAHTLGIIHRDVKPANIYLVRPSLNAPLDCRVIDFGVAKVPQGDSSITRAGAILGTPSYMAPEQASYAMQVDARADVFSLGVVTFELLTGRLPWQSATDLARLARILIEPAMKVHEINPEVPDSVASIIDGMLALKLEERTGSARAVHDRVVKALAELPEGFLDTTFTRDPELLSSFVQEETRDIPIPALARKSPVADLKTEGVLMGPDGHPVLDLRHQPQPEDVQSGGMQKSKSEATKVIDRMRQTTNPTEEPQRKAPTSAEIDTIERIPPVEQKPAIAAKLEPKPRDVGLRPVRPLDSSRSAPVESGAGTLLFGRVQEIDALKHRVLRSLASQSPSLTLVIGPAGIGKTRVRMELAKVLRSSTTAPRVLSGRAEESARSSPLSFLRRLLIAEARIGSGDPPADNQKKLLDLLPTELALTTLMLRAEPPLAPEEDEDEPPHERTVFAGQERWPSDPSAKSTMHDHDERSNVAAFLASALRISAPNTPALESARTDPRFMGDQIRRAFDVLLASMAKESGLVVLADDAHLIDHSSAQILAALARPERGLRIAIVGFGLPAMLDENAPSKTAFATQLAQATELSALDSRASRELARSLVKGSLESTALETLVKRGAGNPLYLEQLVRAVVALGVLVASPQGELALVGLLGDERDDDRIPPTIAAAVASRIGHMKHDLQRALSAAAVFGEVFWAEGVALLIEQPAEETKKHLDLLFAEGVVRPRPSSRYAGQTEMEFSHGVIRSVALSRLKRKRRQRFERTAAEYLGSVGEEDEAQLAVHTASSGQAKEAAELYARAAEASLGLGSLRSAALAADEGIALAEIASEIQTKRRLLDLAERTAVLERDWTVAGEAIEGLLSIAEAPAERAVLFERRSRIAFLSRRFADAASDARHAASLHSPENRAEAQLCLAEASEASGDGRGALRAFIAAQSGFNAEQNASGMARATRGLARIAISSGDYRSAENRFRESLVHAQSVRDSESAFLASLGLADVARLMGEASRARALLADAHPFAHDVERWSLIDLLRARILTEEEELAEAKKKIEGVHKLAISRPELGRLARLSSLQLAQLVLAFPPSRPLQRDQLIEIADRAEASLEGAPSEDPALVVALQSALSVVCALIDRRDRAKSLDQGALDRFMSEGAAVEEEPPRLLLAHARVLELLGERGDRLRGAWAEAISHLDSIAGRLDRETRKRYFARDHGRAIIQGAEKAGLELDRNASSNRIGLAGRTST
jgi:serine/threonine protein kinase/predicted ATPase